jgi:outer membrane lipase/esterase
MGRKIWAFAIVVFMAPAFAAAAPITSLYVFGDSLSDQGNAFILTGGFPPQPYAQRASNGPVAVERLANDLGIALAPAALGGTNYAVVGATSGTANISATVYQQPVLAGTGLLTQVGEFLLTGPVSDPTGSLFFVWAGANDLFVDPSQQAVLTAVTNIATAVTALYGDGARRFLVPNLPDLSLTPFGLAQPPAQRAGLQALSSGFNLALANALTGLMQLPGINITPFDTFGQLTDISNNPGAYGFTNASAPCLTGNIVVGGMVCANPDSFVFWDTLHPTTAAHRVLGDAFDRAVPEPATLTLVGLGMALAIVRRRRG